jgi:hypothetical protein
VEVTVTVVLPATLATVAALCLRYDCVVAAMVPELPLV